MSKKIKEPKNKVKPLRVPSFEVDDYKNWKEYFNKEGYVVIKNILTTELKEKVINMFKKELKEISPNFDWNDKKTWISKNTPSVWGKGSLVFNGFGQSNSNWELRLQSKAKEVFSKIYDDEDLVVSFDGLNMYVSEKQKSKSWLHQDQRPTDNRLSVQGVLNLLPCNEFDAGFICVPKSHIEYKPPNDKEYKKDWIVLPPGNDYESKSVKLIVPERSLILFHSKLIHSNTGMAKNHPNKVCLNRLSAYITFVPRKRQTKKAYEDRMKGYFTGKCTSHWADRYEPKNIPFHIRKRINSFNNLKPLVDKDGKIPEDRLCFI